MFDLFWGRGVPIPATRISTTYLFNCLTFLGLNLPRVRRPVHYLYAFIMNLNILVFLPMAFTLSYFLILDKMTIAQVITSLSVAINVWGLPVKSTTVNLNVNRLRKAEDIMDILDARCHLEEEILKIRKLIKTGNRFPVIFSTVYIIYSSSALLTSLVMRQPPYSLFMPLIDWRNTTWEFCLQAFIEYMVMNVTCMHQSVDDAYSVLYIRIMRTHMDILVNRVKRLGSDELKTKDQNYQELVDCIKDHQNLLRLLDTVSPVISITIFTQFAITAAVLGLTMINMFIFADTSEQVGGLIYFLAVQLQTAPCCYQATCLFEDSDKLPVVILHSNWMGEDKRFRKMLIFFMQRSQKSMTLTAMKLFPITLNTYLSIAKFSFSLYTLIKKMDFGQQLNK